MEKGLTAVLRPLLRIVPLWVEAIGAGFFMARIVENNPAFKQRLDELDGKVFLFEVSDIKRSFYVLIRDRQMRVVPHMARTPDVVMRGKMDVLVRLLLGKEDPDTVFFTRRLDITGDTAAAILLKNLLAEL